MRLTAVFACGPALAGGLALILLSAPPAAADFFGFPGQWQQRNWNAERPPAAKPQHKSHRTARPSKHETAHKEPRPQGPFQIVVSIAKQQVAVYGQDGLVMQAPISTGMPGHPTPLGVFTVLSKAKWHQSNIYSGAPMPYMQRVTWSGIAMHAGPRPGYPASHGCIRLPEDFAVRLFHTTKVGARVIITREPAAPAGIVHPKLFVPKPPEAKVAAVTPASATAKDTISFAANTAVIVKPTDAATKTDATGAIATIPIPPTGRLANEPPHPDKPISVFVSRKQNKVFVRRGTTPLFNMPATISEPESPIGTHVFTAMGLKDDGKAMRWMVVSVPSTTAITSAAPASDIAATRPRRPNRLRRLRAASEALDRITLPPEAIERISALLLPGSSLIVSDNALSDETDADTDFIVETR